MVICQLCNKQFRNLSSHINSKHGVSKQEYIAQFPDAKIVSDELSKRFSKRAEQMHKSLKESNYEQYSTVRKETCKLMRDKKGQGFKHSQQTKLKMKLSAIHRPARLPHTDETKYRISIKNKGKKVNLSEESKTIKSAKQKEKWVIRREDETLFNLYIAKLSQRRSEYIKIHGTALPKKGKLTNIEKKFIDFLREKNIEYFYQYFLEGKNYDFYLPTFHLLVEVDGEYWHRMPQAIKNDLEKHIIAKDQGYKLLRITEKHWHPGMIFETDYSCIVNHNYGILNKRTMECQNYEISKSMI